MIDASLLKEIYAWVGKDFFKWCDFPLASGKSERRLIPWSRERIINDLGKDAIKEIPTYDGFCNVPSHLNYQASVGNFFNAYKPLSYQPAEEAGEWPHIEALMRHIFGEQYEIGLDYLQLLYTRPMHPLPIILLVSKERGTGKSTFLNFLKEIFGANATFVRNEDLRSQFNGDWASALLVLVDETLLNRREDSERFKALSTGLKNKLENKGQNRYEIDSFYKFVLTSNNEDFPVIIDDEETRYLVRKVGHLELDDVDMLAHIREEIPAFLFFLLHRQMFTTRTTRMWFSREELETDAERRIKLSCISLAEKDLAMLISQVFEKNPEVENLQFSTGDLNALATSLSIRLNIHDAKDILLNRWCVDFDNTGGKTYLFSDAFGCSCKRKGRYFTVTREFFYRRFPDM